MAAIETANKVHAMGLFFLGTTQEFTVEVRNNGFVAGSLVRISTGVFLIGLVEKLAPTDAGCIITPAGDGPRFVSARIQPADPDFPDRNVFINTYDAAGEFADIGEIYLEVARFPVG